jgi:hypothetical protein
MNANKQKHSKHSKATQQNIKNAPKYKETNQNTKSYKIPQKLKHVHNLKKLHIT